MASTDGNRARASSLEPGRRTFSQVIGGLPTMRPGRATQVAARLVTLPDVD
jgi:hypothetical protein